MSHAKKSELLNQYQAAAAVGLSPKLLEWLTSYAPKSGEKRKLKVADKVGEELFFEDKEIRDFDAWLRAPWPRKGDARPPVPKGIKDEIIDEAGGSCAICHSHKDSCEAAHIDPVAKSNNNHPHNLIWLCANHHTCFDKGLLKGVYGPRKEDEGFIHGFKLALQRFNRVLWTKQAEACRRAFLLLENCDSLEKQLAAATTPSQVKAVEDLAEKTLAALPKLGPPPSADPHILAFVSVQKDVAALGNESISRLPTRLKTAAGIRARYAAALGYVRCPLCEGKGYYEGSECPVCDGDREVPESVACRVNTRDFEPVTCPVCHGNGTRKGDFCPVCGGEKTIRRYYFEEIDPRDYEDVRCPLCGGSGKFKGRDCPECGGQGQMEGRFAQLFDATAYEDVNCPLCGGDGRYHGTDCPECGGQGEIERHLADRVDLSAYNEVNCPVCDGKGSRRGMECPACGGERTMERYLADQIDLRDYADVKCPLCRGKRTYMGEDCPACGGDGEVERRQAEQIDLRDYAMVKCPVCRGRRTVDGYECRDCGGEGEMQRRFLDRY